jgi:hypothetical protein
MAVLFEGAMIVPPPAGAVGASNCHGTLVVLVVLVVMVEQAQVHLVTGDLDEQLLP